MIIYECPECGSALLCELEVGGITKRPLFFSSNWQTGPKIKVGDPDDIDPPERWWECTKCGHVVPVNTYGELWQWVMDHQLPNGQEE